MIFDSTNTDFESYKERNLYYKFLGGFFFNELVDGAEKRLRWFLDTAATNRHIGALGFDGAHPPFPVIDGVYISFDNHEIQHLPSEKVTNRGEFADALLVERSRNWVIGVEAKYLDNWNFEKDIWNNSIRLRKMADHWNIDRYVQVLLIKSSKWRSKKSRKAGAIATLVEHLAKDLLPAMPVVMHWEDFLEFGEATGSSCEAPYEYLSRRLKLRKKGGRWVE